MIAQRDVKRAGEPLGTVHLLESGLEAIGRHLAVEIVAERENGGGRSGKAGSVLLHLLGDCELMGRAGSVVGQSKEVETSGRIGGSSCLGEEAGQRAGS